MVSVNPFLNGLTQTGARDNWGQNTIFTNMPVTIFI
jgi:hypothetical protein